MKHIRGFTLIEVMIFIVVIALLAVIFGTATTTLLKIPTVNKEILAKNAAAQCMEWFLGQKIMNGYSSITCPSTTIPTFCTSPSGYTLSVDVVCTTYNSDSNYKTITVTMSGKSSLSLSMMVGS